MKLPGFLQKEKWALVKTITGSGLTLGAGTAKAKTGGRVFIHLYESSKGNRKIETACSFSEVSQTQLNDYVKTTETYQEKLVRWLNGRYDPEIPKYSQISEEDVMNSLKGLVD